MKFFLRERSIFVFLFYCVHAFPPQPIPEEYETRSVKDIVRRAILQATIQFLPEYGLVNDTGQGYYKMLQDFFGSDVDSQEGLYSTISEITSYANDVQKTKENTALHHANGEQIEMAHHHVRSLKSQIRTHIQTASSADVDILRQKIGQIIYTKVSFYSNTNWVEMNGNNIYLDFGKDNVQFMETADFDTPTCSDCEFTTQALERGSCEDNLKNTGKLTSGYKSGQDMTKPILYGVDSETGKCSHGTPNDTSREYSATGGIYKGRSVAAEAPHFHLHLQASKVATAAVKDFIIGQDGIIDMLGQSLFQEVFSIKRKSESTKASLVLVIDDTGSMSNDIAEVKEELTEAVTVLTDDKLPKNFILVTFNDPVEYGTIQVTESKTEIVSLIENITVNGGGDCPEYAIDGAIRGAEEALSNSNLWLFTDAIAKDHYKGNDLVTLLQTKNISMEIFLREDYCDSTKRRKRSIGISGFDVYQSVATRTGGNVFIGTVSEIGDRMRSLFQKYFPSSTAMVQYESIGISDANTLSFVTDSSVELLKIEIAGTTSFSDIDLQYLNGSSVDFASASNTRTTTSTSVILSLTSLTPGQLILQRLVNNSWEVNITAQTNVDFKVVLLRYHSDGFLYAEPSNPIKGGRYYAVVEVYNLNENSSISNISLADSDGKVVMSTGAVGSIDEFTGNYFGEVIINTKTEYVIIDGTDSYGNRLRRTSYFLIQPTDVELFHEAFTRDLIINQAENVSYALINHGATNVTYLVNITDDKGYIPEPSLFEHTLQPGETVTGTFQILGTRASDVVTYVINVQESSSNEIIQHTQRKLQVTNIERPVCVLSSLVGSCPSSALNSANCSKHEWTAEGEVQYNGVPLDRIKLLNAVSSAKLNYNNESFSSSSGPFLFNISADCCSPRVFIQAVDTDGFYTSCKVEFTSSYIPIFGVTPISSDSADESVIPEEAVLSLAVIGGTVAAAIVIIAVIVISVGIRIHTKQKEQQKVTDSFVDLPDKLDKNRKLAFTEKVYNNPVAPRDTSFRY